MADAHPPKPATVEDVATQPRRLPRIVARIGKSRVAPVPVEFDVSESLESAKSANNHHEVSRKKGARWSSVWIAVAVHILVIVAAFLIKIWSGDPNPPVIEVVGAPITNETERRPSWSAATRRPSRAAAATMAAVVSSQASPIALPPLDDLDDMALDFGIPGAGDGGDLFEVAGGSGAKFLGLSAGKKSKHIILLIDVSGSMLGNCRADGLRAIKKEVAKTVSSFAKDVRFNLITFAGAVDAFQERSVWATDQNKKAAIAFFERYYGSQVGGGDQGLFETRTERFGPKGKDDGGTRFVAITSNKFLDLRGIEGGTRVELGLVAAMQDRPTTIFVISDGEPGSTRQGRTLSDDELVRLIDSEFRRRYRGTIPLQVSTISVKGLGASFLRKISSKFGGYHTNIQPEQL